MKKGIVKVIVLLLVTALTVTMLSSCSNKGASTDPGLSSKQDTPAATPTGSANPGTKVEDLTFPIVKDPITITIFWALNPKATASIKDYSEMTLFKELEKIYGMGKYSLGQIRSAVVPYTISLIFRYMNENNTSTSNFKIVDIWKNNGLSGELNHTMRKLMILVNSLLLDKKLTDDVNESSKKPEQWNIIKDCREIKEFFKDPNSKKIFNKYKFTQEQLDQRYPQLEYYKKETSSITSDTWFALAKWAKENNKFGTTERKFLYSIGKYANSNGLSPKQAKWAHSLYIQATADGFEVE
jgi:hypothetical protein